MQLIVAAVVALVGLAGPLSAAVVGIGGAFAGMGAAGALAIVGVVDQIKKGTAAGNEWSSGLNALKGDLNALGNTAATGLLSSFQQIIGDIGNAMPDLNSEIGTFASILGRTSVSSVQALINVFRVMNPLFVQGGVLIEDIANGLLQWSQNGGLQRFVTYAEQELPHVVNTLGDVGSMLLHIVEATAPIGSTVLTILQQFSQFVSAIPVPVLTATAGAALAIWAAFKLGNGVESIIDKVTGAVGQLTAAEVDSAGAATRLGTSIGSVAGWFGVVTAAVGVGVAAVDAWKQAVEDSVASDADLVNSITAGTDAAGGFTDAMKAVNAWNDTGTTTTKQMSDALESAANGWGGMNKAAASWLGTLDGGASISGNVLNMLEKYGDSLATVARTDLPAAVDSFKKYSAQYDLNATQQWRAINNMGDYKDALTQQATQWGYAATQANLVAIATGKITDANPAATDTTDKLANAQNRLSLAQQQVATDTDAAATAIEGFGQASRNADRANITYQQALDQASQSIRQNGRTLDENTESGRANATALDTIADSGLSLIAAQTRQGASEQTLRGNMQTTRDAFIKTAEQMGDNQTQAEQLADKYGLIPSNITTAFAQTGLGDAIQNVNTYDAAIRALLSDQRAVKLGGSVAGYYGFGSATGGTAGKPGKAAGGTIGMAPGGTVTGRGNAVNDLAGLYRLADGEEVTSNMAGQAARNRPLLKLINANAGADQIAGKAIQLAGGAPTVAAPAPVIQHVHNWYVTSNSGEQLYQDVMRKTNSKVGP
ncbi:hypothetical protein FPZ11_14300 [Humibacter ginsenosidimutans]|uniref:Bacteriophage tail tape measure N-terminal domain-containing protein n=2 Tax=Humibacter ginsenosidimutans TaxID=2599293 RepID=A0A5B8M661_9MICO|nr:hypothetical protein FPZ11_14300 [Humibacter ginsenosidimutans]